MKTNAPTARSQPPILTPHAQTLLAGAVLVFAIVAAYANSLSAPFVFDDIAAIRDNPTIRHLWPLSDVLAPPSEQGATVGGRPVVNLTLSLNWAWSGEAVGSYHATNLAIHCGAALLLFGVVRRTLRRPVLCAQFGADARPLAFAAAALWALHPLHTESVTYVVQRAESLAGYFCLLTLYAFVRSTESAAPRRWSALCVGACLLGMATKETMVVVPLLVLLYDRTFVAGTWREAWRRRRRLHLALAVTWLPLVWLTLGTAGRGGTAGFDTPVSAWTYALSQCVAVVRYLGLAVWPHPLVFDYGISVVQKPLETLSFALALLVLLAVTVRALVCRPTLGFAGAWFFITLAPSSSFVPIASQTMAEHRMYLALIAVVVVVVLGLHHRFGRHSLWVWCAIAVSAGAITWQRNSVYQSELSLWENTVSHRSGNARAHSNLGNALLAAGRASEAIPRYLEALRLSPGFADAHNNLGRALVQVGRTAEAIPHYEAALATKPDSVDALTNLGSALAAVGRRPEAMAIYERALRIKPDAPGLRYNLGNAFFQAGDFSAAAAAYEKALLLQPANQDARFNLAAALARLGRINEAVQAYEELIARVPDDAVAHAELANLLAHLGRAADAIAHYEAALRLRPNFPVAREQLSRLRSPGGQAKP